MQKIENAASTIREIWAYQHPVNIIKKLHDIIFA